MKELRLIRTDSNEYQTMGVLALVENSNTLLFDCKTLELPWKDNRTGISCIPEGRYTARRRSSPKYGNHIWLTDVPNRDMILIHNGNYNNQTHGCILVGKELKDINGDGQLDVTDSVNTMKKLMGFMTDEDLPLLITTVKK
jgi:hypothetical protein